MDYPIRELPFDLVEGYAWAQIEMTALTHAHIAPPSFKESLTAELDGMIDAMSANIRQLQATGSARRRYWVAENHLGGIVGIVSSGWGHDTWDVEIAKDAWVAPATDRILDHLYTVPGTYGSGLGQALLDTALPDGDAAYLWAVAENTRALRFYEKNGFRLDGFQLRSTPEWGGTQSVRLIRKQQSHPTATR